MNDPAIDPTPAPVVDPTPAPTPAVDPLLDKVKKSDPPEPGIPAPAPAPLPEDKEVEHTGSVFGIPFRTVRTK